jgi:hypothetical protein
MPPTPVLLTPPMIDDLELTLTRDVANVEVTVNYRINWPAFDQLTNLSYSESWSLVALDGSAKTTIFTGPSFIGGVSSNGNASTDRTKTATIPWADLDEDVNDDDEIAAVVTLTPKLPTAKTAQSATVVVNSP